MGTPILTTVRKEILNALAQVDQPLGNAELRAHCPSAQTSDQISNALYVLNKRGLIAAEPGAHPGANGKRNPVYRLAASANAPVSLDAEETQRLTAHLEQQLEAPPAPPAPDRDPDRESRTLNGTAHPEPDPARTDPVICAIDRLTEPHWVDGPMHAQLLHRLADAPLMAKQPDVRAWLTDLANIIEELSA